jgi:hypothetical protein
VVAALRNGAAIAYQVTGRISGSCCDSIHCHKGYKAAVYCSDDEILSDRHTSVCSSSGPSNMVGRSLG